MKTTSFVLMLLSAVVALALNFLLNLASNYLSTDLEPYRLYVFISLALLFIVSLVLLYFDSKRTTSNGGITVQQRTTGGGKIRRSPISTTNSDRFEIVQTADQNGEIVDSGITAARVENVTLRQQAHGQASKIEDSNISLS